MKREIKATKKTNDQPMTTIKIAKSMTIKIKIAKSMTIKMEAKTYFKKKMMIMTTKTTMMRVTIPTIKISRVIKNDPTTKMINKKVIRKDPTTKTIDKKVIRKDLTIKTIDKRVIKKDPTKEIPTITINKEVINMVQATVRDIIETETEGHDMMMTTALQMLKMSMKEVLLSNEKTISRTSHGRKLRRQKIHKLFTVS